MASLVRRLDGDGKLKGNYDIKENFNIISIIPQSKRKKGNSWLFDENRIHISRNIHLESFRTLSCS